MPSSENHLHVGVLLILVNVALFALLPILRSEAPGPDSSKSFYTVTDGRLWMRADSVLQTVASSRALFDRIIAERKVLFLGTSESGYAGNLCEQFNHLDPAAPPMVKVARGGLSPIHSTLVFSRAADARVAFPPLVIIVNLVYFTRSHDVINDGWLGNAVPSPVFAQFDLPRTLNTDVRDAYARHFAGRKLIHPVWLLQYVANLVYLRFHRGVPALPEGVPLGVPTYVFDGIRPHYDERLGIHPGHVSIDRFSRARWEVVPAEDSLNLKALRNSVEILRRQPAPVLLLILPMNRRFYAHFGMDMVEFDRRFARIRGAIRAMADAPPFHVLDLYDVPPLDFGFFDRMHADPYGNFQLARYIIGTDVYASFVRAVRAFYDGRSATTSYARSSRSIFP